MLLVLGSGAEAQPGTGAGWESHPGLVMTCPRVRGSDLGVCTEGDGEALAPSRPWTWPWSHKRWLGCVPTCW